MDHPFTSNEELDSLQAGDNTVELTLWVEKIDPPRARRSNSVHGSSPSRVPLFRCIASNTQGKRLRLLFWEARAAEFQSKVLHQVIFISRGRVGLANPAFIDRSLDLMEFEINIQNGTKVELKGNFDPEPAPRIQYHEVNCESITSEEGNVVITAYIKMSFELCTVGNLSYGSGAITDGRYKIRVNIAEYIKREELSVGKHVSIKGETRRDRFNNVYIQVQHMADIELIDEEILSSERLANGFRVPPPANKCS